MVQELSDDNCYIYFDGQETHDYQPIKEFVEKYEHPLWKWYQEVGVKSGHGGMDYLVLSAFVDAVYEGEKPPIDVYDTAAWMSITCLSEQSVAMGGAPVPVPDFTNGRWIDREETRRGMYCLDEVCEETYPEILE
jgi:hypothetical protein